ncbi:hypothetical protein LEP1GSC060_2740 [Leptospira weilii serovar Ranarum str. ICFT]|uniref:Uncharacterized protein n=1 Tax=Leptospira weilii serovar Ranarum str. ICFT TaxID=1218598 RepID=N1WCF0_9LEPT|nr:hypothetical protein LEP1GSC060_2740 [Leptospira weilii serovar Ranarum str. ICFT]
MRLQYDNFEIFSNVTFKFRTTAKIFLDFKALEFINILIHLRRLPQSVLKKEFGFVFQSKKSFCDFFLMLRPQAATLSSNEQLTLI